MASIKPTKVDPVTGDAARDTRWRVRYRDADGNSRSETFDRKADAEAAAAATKTDIRRGDWIDPRKADKGFTELADTWWATTTKLAPTTRRGYHQLLTLHVAPYFGGRKQATIDWLDVEEFIAQKLDEGHSPKRVRDMVSIVSLVMKIAMRAGVRKDNPAAGHSVPVRRRKLSHASVLTMEQAHRLVAHTRDPYKPLVWVLMLCGLRPAEVCGLLVEHLDFPRSALHVTDTFNYVHGFDGQSAYTMRGPAKTDAGDRRLPIPHSLRDDITTMLAARAEKRGGPIDPGEPLFESIRGGKPLVVDALRRRVIRPALEAAGLPTLLRTYDTRHSHATLLIDGGANVLAVAQRMGHTDPGVTLRVYGHLFEGVQQDLTDQIEALRQSTAEPGSLAGAVVDLAARRARRARGSA
jgi:integrase